MELDELDIRCLLEILYNDGGNSLSYRKMAAKIGLSYAGARKRLIRLAQAGLIEDSGPGAPRLSEKGLTITQDMPRHFGHTYTFFRDILDLPDDEAYKNTCCFMCLSRQSRVKLQRYVISEIGEGDSALWAVPAGKPGCYLPKCRAKK